MDTSNYATRFPGDTVHVKMDRQMGSRHPRHEFVYPVNFGFVPETLAPDGAEVDAYVLGVFEPLEEFIGVCVAVIHRTDDDDDKLVVAPAGSAFTDAQIVALTEFQERYFKSETIR